ncbi:hypothetical protein K2173_004656 [Erythroxylum novogranatense]|uniref:peroxidase n=1 Tax=Erythroxylum novogranatense TaxID=1862640 RepID=A0AAV8T531_9ROSI|nr:hypothetical protein K2173_004656 [Erythroxylum novogranatense]
MNFYKDVFLQAQDIIREWSCDASLLLDSTGRALFEETNRSFGLRNFRYIETIKDAIERECPGVVYCSDILVLSAKYGIVVLGSPYIPLKTRRRDGRKSRVDVVERFDAMGINTPGVVALLNSLCEARTPLYLEVDLVLNTEHVEQMLPKCPNVIPDPKDVQYVRNDQGTPMRLDNNCYKNILDNKGLTKPFVKKMAKNQDYFFKEFSKTITILSKNNPLTGNKGKIRK